MKKASAEATAVYELMSQFILSRPDVSFRYINDGKTMLHSPGDGQLASAALTVFGAKAVKTMRTVDGRANGILLKGYVGIGENARGNRGQEYFFINGRMMHSSVLSAALENACRERVMIGKFPVCALQITIAYEAVDVNVHPNKLEVRFRDEAAVSEAVMSLVLEALKDSDAFESPVRMNLVPERKNTPAAETTREELAEGLKKPDTAAGVKAVVSVADKVPDFPVRSVPEAIPVMHEKQESLRPFTRPQQQAAKEPAPPTVDSADRTQDRKAPVPMPVPMERKEETAEQVNTILPEIRKTMKVFGALFNTFILVEYEDQLLLVDQHAVHERLLFDKLMKEHAGQNMGQELLVPMVISVSGKEQSLIEENRELLESIGLIIESFGSHEAAVRTIPMVLGTAETEGYIREALDELERTHTLTFEKKRADLLQTACKHAVKGGEKLTDDQLRSILDEMIEKKVTPTCPHGRPLVVAITHRELDRKFKRIQG